MTNYSTARSKRASLIHRFQDVLSYLNGIVISSKFCGANFNWLLLNKSTSIPLFDFDVICGTLPSIAIERAITDKEILKSIDIVIPDIYPGPYTIKNVISNLAQLYLPPGTIGDMLIWKEKKRGELSSQAKRFLSKLQDAVNSPDPALTICEETHNEKNIFRILHDELTTIATHFDDLNDLDSIFGRNIPIETMLRYSNKRELHNNEAFRSAYGQLMISRPNNPRNNLHDALNVAVVVRMFNIPIDAEGSRLVPFYITQTQDILRLGISSNWFRLPRYQDPPRLFYNNIYLIISRGLALRSDENLHNMIDEANILAQDSALLAQCYNGALSTLSQKHEDEATIDCLTDYEKSILIYRTDCFNKQWGSLFKPVMSAESNDQTTYLNTLLSPDIKNLVLSDSTQGIRKGIETLSEKLKNYKHPLYNFVEIALESNERIDININGPLMGVFELIWFDNDGSLLSEITSKIKRIEEFNDAISDSYDLRFLVRLKNINLPILAFDARFDKNGSDKRYISIVWLHALGIDEIWKASLSVLTQLVGHENISFGYSLFSNDNNYKGNGYFGSTINIVNELVTKTGRINYFDVRSQEYIFYTDTEPLNSIEKQAGVVLPSTSWCNRTRDILINALQQTNQVNLSKRYYDDIFSYFEKHLHFLK